MTDQRAAPGKVSPPLSTPRAAQTPSAAETRYSVRRHLGTLITPTAQPKCSHQLAGCATLP
ncbi:hypothetical protein E2C01_078911 [Portunus trituberculatus]|uniref:Uncharacterized protein n=1 Tax=Portunus trituberculatus TaxID=210409 RepID=A0A5B7IP37_PORTR|nr:hypothetical protein [Portunus trituberculatus]